MGEHRDCTPTVEAVAYGRRVIENEVKRLMDFESQSTERGDLEAAVRWRRTHEWLTHRLLGNGTGCVVTAFDERWLDESFRVGSCTCVRA